MTRVKLDIFSKMCGPERESTHLANFTRVNEGFLVVIQACEWWLPPLYHGRSSFHTSLVVYHGLMHH